MIEKAAHQSNKLRLQIHSSALIHKRKSLPSATTFPSRSTKAYSPTGSLDKLTRNNDVDFGICQDRFLQ